MSRENESYTDWFDGMVSGHGQASQSLGVPRRALPTKPSAH